MRLAAAIIIIGTLLAAGWQSYRDMWIERDRAVWERLVTVTEIIR